MWPGQWNYFVFQVILMYSYIEDHGCKSVVVQSLSCVWLFATPWTAACQASLSFTISWSLLKLKSIDWGMPRNHLILVTPSPSAFNLSQHQGLSEWVYSRIRWPKFWSISFSISLASEYSGLISFRIDWFNLLVLEFGVSLLNDLKDRKINGTNAIRILTILLQLLWDLEWMTWSLSFLSFLLYKIWLKRVPNS